MIPIFADTTHSDHMAKQHAELYMRIYQYAAQDFSSVTDTMNFAKDVIRWAASVEARLTYLGKQLQIHTHQITPHVHPFTHIHTNGNNGSPTGPPIGMKSTFVNAPLQTQIPINAQQLGWPLGVLPLLPFNTTGAISNFVLNRFSPGFPMVGDLTYLHNRRELVIPILMIPVIPPIMKIGLSSII